MKIKLQPSQSKALSCIFIFNNKQMSNTIQPDQEVLAWMDHI